MEGALQDVIGANTALYQAQIDSYNLQRQALGYAVGNVDELNRILNALNNEARLQIGESAGSIQQRQQLLFSQLQSRNAGGSEREVPVTFDSAGNPIDEAGDIIAGISDLDISNLQVQADAAIGVFSDAITAPARTIESLNAAFEALLPELRTLYDSIREQIVGPDGEISDAEQIQLNQLGTFEDFTQQYTDSRDTAIEESIADRIAAEMLYTETVQGIYNSVADAFEAAEARKTEISDRAIEQRDDADERHAETQQGIYNSVAEAFADAEARKTEISDRAIEQRGDAERVHIDTVQGIYNSVAEAFADAEARKTEISDRAIEQRDDADERHADTQQGIYNSVAEAFADAEERKTEIADRAIEQRDDADERHADTQQGIYNSVAEAFADAEERKTEIADRAIEQRDDADERYAESVQDIHNRLFLTVTDIQENLTDTLGDLRQQELDTEADRLDALADLHRGHSRTDNGY